MLKHIIGAYVTSPTLFEWDEARATEYWEAVKALPGVAGIEHPYWGALHPFDEKWFLRTIRPDWDFVFTCVPGTMKRLATNAHFGLASNDEDARCAAVAYTRGALDAVRKLNDHLGRRAVPFVQLHSAPAQLNGVVGRSEAFHRSLADISTWDWDGARLCIEHCDALVPEHPPEKGFLTLDQEIAVLEELNRERGTEIGITINWGRSAIEGRSAETPALHVRMCRERGLLRGLIFSGCQDQEGAYGRWKDTHMPPAPAGDLEWMEPGSLMDSDAMKECLLSAGSGSLDYIGFKIMALPQPTTNERRIGINRDAMRLLDRLLEECGVQ